MAIQIRHAHDGTWQCRLGQTGGREDDLLTIVTAALRWADLPATTSIRVLTYLRERYVEEVTSQ